MDVLFFEKRSSEKNECWKIKQNKTHIVDILALITHQPLIVFLPTRRLPFSRSLLSVLHKMKLSLLHWSGVWSNYLNVLKARRLRLASHWMMSNFESHRHYCFDHNNPNQTIPIDEHHCFEMVSSMWNYLDASTKMLRESSALAENFEQIWNCQSALISLICSDGSLLQGDEIWPMMLCVETRMMIEENVEKEEVPKVPKRKKNLVETKWILSREVLLKAMCIKRKSDDQSQC